MQSSTLAAGDKIEARCTKCRKNIEHLVIQVTGGEPDMVECGLCSSQHKYRPPTASPNPAVRQAGLRKTAERKEWQRLRPSMDKVKAADYSMVRSYKVKTLIDHPVFGLGVVMKMAGPQKIEILFEDGIKIMRCK